MLARGHVDAKELERLIAARQDVKVDHAPDVGRELEVELPLEREGQVARRPWLRQELAMSGRLRVGVLDDERRVVEGAAPFEQEHGHRPAAAEPPNRDPVQERRVPLFAEGNPRGLERPPCLLAEVTERDRDQPVGHARNLAGS